MVDSNFCLQQSFPHNTELCFSNTETKLSSSLRSVCSNQAAYFVNLYYMPHLYSFEFIMHSSPPPELICCILFIYCGRHEVAPAVAAAKSLQSCPTLQPQRRQPTRLPRTWDPPGKNTGVGGHFLLQCVKVKSESEVTQSCLTLRDPMDCSPPGSSIHGIFQARVLEWGAIAFSKPPILGSLTGQMYQMLHFEPTTITSPTPYSLLAVPSQGLSTS